MSDLAATNCGCGCNDGGNNCCSILWIIILLSICGNGSGFNLGNNGCGNNDGCGCLWIILLLLFCGGNNNGCGHSCGNGCGIF